jgi:DNA-directed RNA polymerase
MEDILDSANHPLEGKKWWVQAEDPWQCLASCIEIRNALNHPDGPEHYVSSLPIHQDGSCNGLQHYASLGRDKVGATYVNVVPGSAPQDIYGEIAALVEEKRAADQADGSNSIAATLGGFVRRKVIKQTVMTTVYGVTGYGAKLQIAKQLKDIDGFPQDKVNEGAFYLAEKTFESLNEMFTSSQAIQAWFTDCATVISDDFNKYVEWITPLGLYVMQPYTKTVGKATLEGLLAEKAKQAKGISMTYPKTASLVCKPNTMRQKNGFPPNFVHSLDSSHMMLTSLYLWSQGSTFASVHDCYWTHASDVDVMNKVCRNQFVNLHSQPILENLSKHFEQTYVTADAIPNDSDLARAKVLFKNIPEKGELNLDVVKDSVYFFS